MLRRIPGFTSGTPRRNNYWCRPDYRAPVSFLKPANSPVNLQPDAILNKWWYTYPASPFVAVVFKPVFPGAAFHAWAQVEARFVALRHLRTILLHRNSGFLLAPFPRRHWIRIDPESSIRRFRLRLQTAQFRIRLDPVAVRHSDDRCREFPDLGRRHRQFSWRSSASMTRSRHPYNGLVTVSLRSSGRRRPRPVQVG
jgi:hypothetical protein